MNKSHGTLFKYQVLRRQQQLKFSVQSSFAVYRLDSKDKFSQKLQRNSPKLTNPFSKCTTCFTLERCEEQSLSPESRGAIETKLGEHHDRQMCERRYYYTKKEKSRTDPDNFMSIIIDGMDQGKTSMPHFAGRLAKNINPCALLKTHITGVINHGHGGFHTYVDFNQYSHDPNLTINVILRALKKASEKHGKKLPPTLFVQADNCWRENKNKFVFAFLQLLVEKNIFREIHMSFLYVGHTHEDVDQAFSVYSKKLKVTDVETLPEMLSFFGESEMLTDMFDIKSWLFPQLEELIQISKPLHFKFSRISKEVKTYYKGQHSSEWILLEDNFLKEAPVGKPDVLEPDYGKVDKESNLKLISNIKQFFKKSDSFEFWKKIYTDISSNGHDSNVLSEWILDTLPRQTEIMNNDIVAAIPEHISKLLSKETDIPKIQLKRKKKKTVSQAEVLSNSNRKNCKSKQKKKQKKNGRNKSGHAQFTQTVIRTTVLVPINKEIKHHIWVMIIIDLIGFYIKLLTF